MRRTKKYFFNRLLIIGVGLLLQFLFLLSMLFFLRDYSELFYFLSLFISLGVFLVIIYDDSNPVFKIAWIILILLVPIFGGIFYLSFGGNQLSRKEKKRMIQIEKDTKKHLHFHDWKDENPNIEGRMQSDYIKDYGPYPVYRNTETTYFSSGESYFEDLLIEIKKAHKFIFLEYFIIEEGFVWHSILDVLKEKVKEGVDVRVIYDDFGCITKLPRNYHKKLESLGIKCQVFNKLIPVLSSKYNTRDHRKILVVDGKVAYTGGLNLADEYINRIEVYGHWKDMGLKITGDGVWNFTVMFLSVWRFISKELVDYNSYKTKEAIKCDDFIQPFSDNPLDNEAVGENVYINMINKAKDYVYITTPYLIISSEMINSLCNAAKCGVDIRIITPYKPDKFYVQMVSRSYYSTLLKAGVRIFEYEPGFIHGKNFVCDDLFAVVGTINMDFRSFYHHFECGVWMQSEYNVMPIKEDFIHTQEESIEITEENMNSVFKLNIFKIMMSLVLRIFAPLM